MKPLLASYRVFSMYCSAYFGTLLSVPRNPSFESWTCHFLQLLYHLPVAEGLFPPLHGAASQRREATRGDNSRHPIKTALDSQFLKVLPCDSLINQAPYLNLAGSKSNKLRLSGKNTPGLHPCVLTTTHPCTHCLFQPPPFSRVLHNAACVTEIFDEIHAAGPDLPHTWTPWCNIHGTRFRMYLSQLQKSALMTGFWCSVHIYFPRGVTCGLS